MEAADRMLGRNVAVAPAGLVLGTGNADQRERHAVRIGEGQHGLAKALLQRLVGDALLDEALGPVAERAWRHAEGGLLGLADAAAAGRHACPGEEGEDGAGAAGLVAVIEVIGAGIVEIDGLLDEAQAEDRGCKSRNCAMASPAIAVTWWMPDIVVLLKSGSGLASVAGNIGVSALDWRQSMAIYDVYCLRFGNNRRAGLDKLASLRAFVKVVERGSFSEAGRQLRLSRSAISK